MADMHLNDGLTVQRHKQLGAGGHNFGHLTERCLTCDMRLSDYIEHGERCIGGHMTDGAGGALCCCFAPGQIIARSTEEVTCFHCRDLIKNDACAPSGFDPWATDEGYDIRVRPPGMTVRSGLPQIAPDPWAKQTAAEPAPASVPCRRCGVPIARAVGPICAPCLISIPFLRVPPTLEQRKEWGLSVDSPASEPNPTLEQRYAAFRETVERVVREEAPGAKVVTDYAGMIRELEYPGFVASYNCGEGWVDYWIGSEATTYMVEADLRARFRKMREELGARAMGKR